MKRNQKAALLTKVLQASDSQTARNQLQQLRDSQPQPRIIIDDLGSTDEVVINNDSPVSFRHKGNSHRMPLGLVSGWIRQQGITDRLFVVRPD